MKRKYLPKKMSPNAGAMGLKLEETSRASQVSREQLEGSLLLLSRWFPGVNYIFFSIITKRSDRRLFGDFGAFCEDNRYKLGSCFSSIRYGNGFVAFKGAERRTDVSFATPSSNAGHPGDIGHITSHRRGGESDDGHRHGYD